MDEFEDSIPTFTGLVHLRHHKDHSDEHHKRDNQEERPSHPVDMDQSESSFGHANRRIRQFRQLSGKIVNNDKVQLFVVLMIAINAVMMGIGTFDFVNNNPSINSAFETSDEVFLIIFTVELVFQLVYRGFTLFLDGWLVFDFVIIVTSWSFSSMQIIRAFRIFRALRLVTRIKVMKNLVIAVFNVMPRMAAIGMLLLLIFYIFAVMMTQLFKDLYELGVTDADYFSRLDLTLFTLFQIMTLDAWGDVARQVIAYQSWAWIPFMIFVTISGFIVVNLIIAVICDAVASLHEDVKAKIHGTYEDELEDDELSSLDLREQLESLEEQVDELTRVQEQMLETITFLTKHFQDRHSPRDYDVQLKG